MIVRFFTTGVGLVAVLGEVLGVACLGAVVLGAEDGPLGEPQAPTRTRPLAANTKGPDLVPRAGPCIDVMAGYLEDELDALLKVDPERWRC